MGIVLSRQPDTRLALFAPPYERLSPIDISWTPPTLPPRGLALVWWLADGSEQEDQFQWLYERPHGLPVFIVLPPPDDLKRALPLLRYVNAVDPRSVLPSGRIVTPSYLRDLLRAPPRHFSSAVTGYLTRRGLLPPDKVRNDVRKIFGAVPQTTSITDLARRLYTSRRTLGRRFDAAGLPVPSHWLQFARLLHTILRLHNDSSALFRLAPRAGYPDGFTLSNQMKRFLGCRPTEIRGLFGWEWIIETWIRREARTGGIDPDRYRATVEVYLDESRGDDPDASPGPGPLRLHREAPSDAGVSAAAPDTERSMLL
ncbi:MAG TPA: AraC family transcriptional regulator [Longimicrobiales bacterium]